jgi:hypothetical protein
MRFSIAAIALLAGFVAATPVETVYTTEDVTITSCAATVTNCPGRSSSAIVSSPAATTPAAVSSVVSSPAVSPVAPSVSSSPAVAPYPTSPAASISVITLTTCVPTVTYSTITLTPTAAPTGAPTGAASPSGVKPSGTG